MNTTILASGSLLFLTALVVVYLVWTKGLKKGDNITTGEGANMTTTTSPVVKDRVTGPGSVYRDPASMTPASPDTEVPTYAPEPMTNYAQMKLAFEHRILGPGYAPDATARMTRVVNAERPYELVRCGSVNGYAIRWMGRFLVVNTDGTVMWSDRRDEPPGCWMIEPGYCGGDGAEFVMFRSIFNNNFLRVDGDTKKLVCVDAPTSENAGQYCWRLQKNAPIKRRCGTYYDEDYGRVINVPCEIIEDPPPGKDCSAVTPGYMAKCCLRHGQDKSCRSVVLREVVGRGLNEASLYIKTRFPDHKIVTCARGDACERANPFPLYKSDTWVLRYDRRLGTIHYPAFRFI
jgi:hypothetical protein